MTKTKITKKVKQELKNIIDSKGYWSQEVKEYLSQFDYITGKKLASAGQVYSKYQYGL